MFSSIRLGLDHLYHNSRASWFALHPVDIPLVKAETVQALLLMARSLNGGVLYPSCKHRKGHPPLIHRNLIPHILSWNGDMGLRGALKGAAAQYLNINDTAVLADMDYPHDYARALRIFHAGNFVPLETCHAH